MTRFRVSAGSVPGLAALVAMALSLAPAPARAQSSGGPQSGAGAQSRGRPFQVGTRSVELRLGSYDSFGLGRFVSATRERTWLLGVKATVNDRTAGTTSTVGLSFGPHWRFYMRDRGPIAPFLTLGVDLTGGRDTSGGPVTADAGVRGVAGIGVAWLPAPDVAVGGYTGADLSSVWSWQNSRVTDWQLSLATLTTGLSLRIYF